MPRGIWFVTRGLMSIDDTRYGGHSTDSTTYTGGAVFLGQFDTANDAANGIVAADYDATVQYFFYDRGDQRVEWLSAYTAPVTQEPFWDILARPDGREPDHASPGGG